MRLTCVVDLLQFLPHEIRWLIFQHLAFQAHPTPENLVALVATTTQNVNDIKRKQNIFIPLGHMQT